MSKLDDINLYGEFISKWKDPKGNIVRAFFHDTRCRWDAERYNRGDLEVLDEAGLPSYTIPQGSMVYEAADGKIYTQNALYFQEKYELAEGAGEL